MYNGGTVVLKSNIYFMKNEKKIDEKKNTVKYPQGISDELRIYL